MKKKRIIILLSAFIFSMLIIVSAVYLKNQKKLESFSSMLQYSDQNSGFSNLPKNEKFAYIRLFEAVESQEEEVSLKQFNVPSSDLDKIWFAIYRDNPDIFWVDTFKYNETSKGTIDTAFVVYLFTQGEKEVMQKEIEANADDMLSGLSDEMDDFEKVKYLHDTIIQNTVYDEEAENNQNIYSVFANGRSVCAGYSKALQYLLQKSGVYSTVVIGTNAEGIGHCVNLVYMDDEYCYIDVASDDFSDEFQNGIGYVYFGITSADLEKVFTIDANLMNPVECTAINDNYYFHENLFFQNSDAYIDSFGDCVHAGETRFEGRVSDQSDIDRILGEIQNDFVGKYRRIHFVRTDAIPTLTLEIEY